MITEDETLTFNFAGEEVEVTDWDGDTITFTKGTEISLTEGGRDEVEGKTITLKMVSENYVFVDVAGVSKKLYEDETEKINGVEIKVTDIIETKEWRLGIATLKIGEDISFEVTDGDEYEANDNWEWTVDSNSIGWTLIEPHIYVEEDDENLALAVGGKLGLPNGYVNIGYDGLVAEDTAEYTFKIKDSFVEVRGDVVDGMHSYDKVYVDATGIYDDRDMDDIELNVTTIKLGDTDLSLTLDNNYMLIDDLKMSLDLKELYVGGTDICNEEEDYLTNYGVTITDPENGCEDEEFEIVIPEEELTASITIAYKQ